MNCEPTLVETKADRTIWKCAVCGFTGNVPSVHFPNRIYRNCPLSPQVPKACGAGCQLSAILRSLGFKYSPGCECESHAREMDVKGIAWCENNESTIVGWMEVEAATRELPFSRIAARQIVRLAIRRAKRDVARYERDVKLATTHRLKPRSDSPRLF